MLDHESKEAYRNIRLSRDLRDDILARHKRRFAWSAPALLRPAGALAAVVLAVTVILAAANRTKPHLYMGDTPLGERESATVAESVEYTGGAARAAFALPGENTPEQTHSAQAIPFRAVYEKDVFVTVDGGTLLLPFQDGQYVFAGQSGPLADNAVFYWRTEGAEERSPLRAEITDTDGILLGAITLTYDAQSGAWTATADQYKK